MDRKKMLQVLLPAAAAGGMVLLVGLLIALGDSGSTTPTSGKDKETASTFGNPPFPLDAPDWKPVGTAGLKVWDVKEGTGEPIPEGALPIMHYTGWLTTGTKFDSSKDRGKPLDMRLGQLIAGWQVGVPGMKPGGVRRLYIPYILGYGERGSPPSIPPKADLLFEMELLEWKK
jgi:hypothetical protein